MRYIWLVLFLCLLFMYFSILRSVHTENTRLKKMLDNVAEHSNTVAVPSKSIEHAKRPNSIEHAKRPNMHAKRPKSIEHAKVYKWHQVSSQYNDNIWRESNCRCKYTDHVNEADFVFAHPYKSIIHKYKQNQMWISQFWESEELYPSKNTQPFDYTISYREDADFPNYAMILDTFDKDKLLDIVPYDIKIKQEMISVWISDCNAKGRNNILTILKKKGITVAQYGRCDRDHDDTEPLKYASHQLKDLDQLKAANVQKMVHSSQHLFMFAAENSISPYYHTEKVYHGLMSGSVPVYFGANTIDKYVPKHSIIKVSEHKNIAEYLKKVASDISLYNEYLEWRNKPLPSYFLDKLNYKPKSACDICNTLISKNQSAPTTQSAPTSPRRPPRPKAPPRRAHTTQSAHTAQGAPTAQGAHA